MKTIRLLLRRCRTELRRTRHLTPCLFAAESLLLLVLFLLRMNSAGPRWDGTFPLAVGLLSAFFLSAAVMAAQVHRDMQTGFLRRLFATPARPRDLFLGFALCGFLLCLAEATAGLALWVLLGLFNDARPALPDLLGAWAVLLPAAWTVPCLGICLGCAHTPRRFGAGLFVFFAVGGFLLWVTWIPGTPEWLTVFLRLLPVRLEAALSADVLAGGLHAFLPIWVRVLLSFAYALLGLPALSAAAEKARNHQTYDNSLS